MGMTPERKAPERLWIHEYNDCPENHYWAFPSEEASQKWRRLANYNGTTIYAPESLLLSSQRRVSELEKRIEKAAEFVRLAIEEMEENGTPSNAFEMDQLLFARAALGKRG